MKPFILMRTISIKKSITFIFIMCSGISLFSQKLIPFLCSDGKYGFVNEKKEIVISCQFDYVEPFNNDVAIVGEGFWEVTDKWNSGRLSYQFKGKKGIINKSGKLIAAIQYDNIYSFKDGLALFAKKVYDASGYLQDELFGYLNTQGVEVVKADKYNMANEFAEGLACVGKGNFMAGAVVGKYGYINKKGQLIIPLKYDEAAPFSEGMARVGIGEHNPMFFGKYGFINKTGVLVVPAKYELASDYSNGLASVKLNNKWGYIDVTGKIVIPIQYEFAGDFVNGLAYVTKGEKKLLINKTGKIVKEITDAEYYLSKKNPLNIIETKCNERLVCKKKLLDFNYNAITTPYDEIWDYSNRFTQVELNKQYGFVNKKGEQVIECKYNKVLQNFNNEGLAMVAKSSKIFCIDTLGNEYIEKSILDNILIPYHKGKYWGFANAKKEIIVEPKYLDCSGCFIFNNGFAKVKGANAIDKIGLVDTKGNEVLPANSSEEIFFNQDYAFFVEQYYNKGKGYRILNLKNGEKSKFIDCSSLSYIGNNYFSCGPVVYNFNKEQIINVNDVINKYGEISVVYYFDGNRIIVQNKNYKRGIINVSGDTLCAFKYDFLSIDSEIKKNKKEYMRVGIDINKYKRLYGIIDFNGNTLIPCNYQTVYSLANYIILKDTLNNYKILDYNLNEICKKTFSDKNIKIFNNYSFLTGYYDTDTKKYGIINLKTGNLVIEPKYYDVISCFNNKCFVVYNSKYCLIDIKGNVLKEFTYEIANVNKSYIYNYDNYLVKGTITNGAGKFSFYVDFDGNEYYADPMFENNTKNNKTNSGSNNNTPPKLNLSFTQDYNVYVYPNNATKETNIRIVVTPNSIQEYIYGNKAYVPWGSECRIKASINYTANGKSGYLYECTSGKKYFFYQVDGKNVVLIENADGTTSHSYLQY